MSVSHHTTDRGRLIARLLARSWRSNGSHPALTNSELEEVTRLLIQSGAGAVAWWRIRDSELAQGPAANELHQLYRMHRLEASVHRERVKRFIAVLRRAGIEAVLVKGWSVARLYAEPGLRSYLDVDLCVASECYDEAVRLLAGLPDGSYVDLHRELDHLDVMPWAEFFARTELIAIDDLEVRVPCAEDHLRILCIHWLRHGAWKPAGLCDVGAVLESLPANFDWQRCLGDDPVRAGWVASTIRLAQDLLGADCQAQSAKGKEEVQEFAERATGKNSSFVGDSLPFAVSALPRWMIPAVLRQWGRSQSPNYRYPLISALAAVNSWRELVDEIRSRWDQPIRATIAVRGRFNSSPRWPYQLCELVLHLPEVARQVRDMITRAGTNRAVEVRQHRNDLRFEC